MIRLWHGTTTYALPGIRKHGLGLPGRREVFLAADEPTAQSYARDQAEYLLESDIHSKPVVVEVLVDPAKLAPDDRHADPDAGYTQSFETTGGAIHLGNVPAAQITKITVEEDWSEE